MLEVDIKKHAIFCNYT